MAFALGAQAVNATPGDSATTHTASLTFSSADLVVVCIASRDNVAVTSVGDSVNGAASYTRAGAASLNSSVTTYAEIWFFENSGSGAATITVTWGSSVRAGINAQRWTGAATSSALDQNNEDTTDSATSHPHGSITTTGAGVMITSAGFSGGAGSRTPEGTFTALTGNDAEGYDRSAFAYRIVTGSTTDENTLTTANSAFSAGKIASFNEPAAGGRIMSSLVQSGGLAGAGGIAGHGGGLAG